MKLTAWPSRAASTWSTLPSGGASSSWTCPLLNGDLAARWFNPRDGSYGETVNSVGRIGAEYLRSR